MSKRAYLIHGWGDSPLGSWFPWLKLELEEKGYQVSVPAMPHPERPTIEDWVAALSTAVDPMPDEETVLVGHSVGCQTILRYIQKLPEEVEIGQVALVAPWLVLSGIEKDEEGIAKPWLETPIDFGAIRKRVDRFGLLFSEDDPYVPIRENVDLFHEALLDAFGMILPNKGHISGFDNPPVRELPEIFQVLQV